MLFIVSRPGSRRRREVEDLCSVFLNAWSVPKRLVVPLCQSEQIQIFDRESYTSGLDEYPDEATWVEDDTMHQARVRRYHVIEDRLVTFSNPVRRETAVEHSAS